MLPHPIRRSRLAALLALAAVAIVLTACGGDDGESPQGLLTESGERTFEAGTARAAFTVELSGAPGLPPGGVSFAGEGVFDFERELGRISMDMSDLLASAGAGQVDGSIELLTHDMVLFLRAPFLNQALGVDTPWVRLDLAALAEAEVGADLDQLNRFTSNDPRRVLAMLGGVTEDGIEEIGEEDVRGVGTTHYRAAVDLERAYEEAGAITDRAAFRRFIDEIGRSEVVLDAWLDDDGLLRRVEYAVPLPDGSGESRSQVELFDFGVEVDVATPPEADTTDLTSLF
jgi:hypothetical protein